MQRRQVDVAILGAGTAGLNARRAAESAGADAVLIDPGPFGTTCARVGCMPSKLLIAAAEAVHHAHEGAVFGFDATVQVDGPRVMARVQAERDRFVGFVLEGIDAHRKAGRLIEGRGRLVGPHTVQVGDHTEVTAGTIVVATGTRPFVPPPFRGLSPAVTLSNDTVFELEDLPDSLLVVGGGVIGLELGQAMHRLGVRVTIVGIRGEVGPLQDRHSKASAIAALGTELDLHLDYTLEEIRETPDGVEARWANPDGTRHEGRWSRVLLAAGRRANLGELGLEHAGVSLDEAGQVAFDPFTMQVGDTHVFVAGDVNARRALLHEATDEGRIAGANAASFPAVHAHPRSTALAVMFTDPQIAVVGQAWRELDCAGNRVGVVDYGNQGRARVMNRHKGLVRIYGEYGSGRLLGAEMVGPGVEHTAHLLAWVVQQGLTVDEVLTMPFYHPVVEEGIRTALKDLRRALGEARPVGARCDEFGVGA